MSSGLDVQVLTDRQDDVSTVRALHRLAAAHSTVLVVTIAPDQRTTTAIIWAILRALGKRTAYLGRATPTWTDAERWLTVHGVRELLVLRAQHLTDASCIALRDAATRAELDQLVLITNHDEHRWPQIQAREISSIATLLEDAREPSRQLLRAPPTWPAVPRSHPLRLRYDCLHTLQQPDFQRVDELLNATSSSIEGWLSSRPNPTMTELEGMLSVVLQAGGPDHAHIRRCATECALLRAGLTVPDPRPEPAPGPSVDPADAHEVLGYTDALAGARRLASLMTGLGPELLDLVGGDQLTDESILGHTAPEAARPVLRAIAKTTGPIFPRVVQLREARSADRPETAAQNEPVVAILAQLLGGRAHSVNAAELTSTVRRQLDKLVAQRILDLQRDAYRASHVALYSSFRVISPPHHPLTSR